MDDNETDGTKPSENAPAAKPEDPRNGKRSRKRGRDPGAAFGGSQSFDIAKVTGLDTERFRALTRPAFLDQIEGIAALSQGTAGFARSSDLARSAISAHITTDEVIKNLVSSSHLGVWQDLSEMKGIAESAGSYAKFSGLTGEAHRALLWDAGRLSAQFTTVGIDRSFLGALRANLGITSKIQDLVVSITGTAALGDTSKLVTAANPMAKYGTQLQAQADTRDVLLRAAAVAAPTHRLLAARPLAAYQRLLQQLTWPPGLAGLGVHERDEPGSVGLLHGHAVDGLVARDALFHPPSGERLDDLLDLVETRVIEPWCSARHRVGEYLHSALFAVDPKLAELFSGAWETLERQGAGYVEATCHLILETLQRALWAMAPDDDVLAWAAEQRVPENDVKSSGRVTRRVRLRYLFFTGSKSERKLVVAEIETIDKSLEALVGRLNAGKHASEADLATCRAHLCSVEAVLLRLFAAGPQDV